MSFTSKIADRGGRPFVIVTIEGVGDAVGLIKWCDQEPARYTQSGDYRALMRTRPTIEPEKVNPLGGVAEQSELTVELVDLDDQLTALFRTLSRPVTYLSSDATAADTTLTLASLSGITLGSSILFIGREAILADTLVAGTTIDVGRAKLDTEAGPHVAGRPVYLYTPSLYGRRLRLFLSFDDEDYSAADEHELGGGWWVDTFELVELGAWKLQARSRLRHLDRLLARVIFRGELTAAEWNAAVLHVQSIDPRSGATAINTHFGDRVFLDLGGQEIIRVDPSETDATLVSVERRGVAGTLGETWELQDEVRQVYVADPADGYGSFRYQDLGGETASRSSGTWIATDHPVPILLALLTSWSSMAKTSPDNYDGTAGSETGNYSALPAGVGLGIPIAQVDVDSFLDVWHRSSNFRLPFLMLREPVVGREFIDAQICRVAGYDLKVSASRIALDYFRVPLEGEASTTWDDSVVLAEEDEEGNRRPRISVAFDTSLTAGAVVFTARTSRGAKTESVFSDVTFPEFFGDADGLYEAEDQRIEIDAPGVRVDASGAEPEVLRQRAMQLLYRHRRPLLRVELSTDLSQEGVNPGALVLLTNAQVPDLELGTRGVTNLVCRVLTKGALEVGDGMVARSWTLIAYGGGGRFGRISPSARISSVVGSVVTTPANRYTDPHARGALPDTDSEGFTVGDRVRLTDRSGLPIATVPAYQTVTVVGAGSLTLDGNFGGSGSFAAGKILEYVGRDSTTATQAARFVHLADATSRDPGTSGERAWTYGEP